MPHRNTIDGAFKEALADIPRLFAGKVAERKLREAGLEPTDALILKLVGYMLDGAGEYAEISDPELPADLLIEITDDDIEWLDEETDNFLKRDLPGIVQKQLTAASRDLLRTLKRNWPDRHAWEREVHAGFQRRLEKRWARGLNGLRMLLTISREIGEERHKKFIRSRSKRNRARDFVLLWLHARACQVTAEIILLLENGYADGAMARWRTLHEISVVATLIAEHGDELAVRYLAHEAVESMATLKTRLETLGELGYSPPSKREIAAVEKAYRAVVTEFGPEFERHYGWAAAHIKPCNTFSDLAQAAGRSRLRAHYKLASHNVHAGVKGITEKLGTMGERRMIAGASNAGLCEPGENTAIAIGLMTLFLFQPHPAADNAVKLKMLSDLQTETINGFLAASRQLSREERAEQRRA